MQKRGLTAHQRDTMTTASPAAHPHRSFAYAGRSWRLFKRRDDPRAAWYFYFAFERERFGPKSLKTCTWSLAVEEAKLCIDALRSRRREAIELAMGRRKVTPVTPPCCSLSEMFAAVPALAIRASQHGRDQYVWAMRWVLARALGKTAEEINALPASVLTADTARAFFVSVLREAQNLPSPAAQNKFKRTALQIFGFACALIAPAATESMRVDCGLAVPDVAGFRKGNKVGQAMLNPGDASEFHAPEDGVIRTTLREWLKLARTPGYMLPVGAYEGKPLPEWLRRNMFVAMGLMLSCGLRKSEVWKAKWSWFEIIGHIPHLRCLDLPVKSGQNKVDIVPLDPFWHWLNVWVERNGWRTGENCLTERAKTVGDHARLHFRVGGKSDRIYWPFYHVGKWLRTLGWTTQKSNHALRDYVCSQVTMRYGLAAACAFARHSQQATTEAHYNSFVTVDSLARNNLTWLKWATAFTRP